MLPTQTEKLSGNLASNLRHMRTQRSLTQAKLAVLSGIPRSSIANLETGLGNPTLAILATLAAALQVRIEELLAAPRQSGRLYRRGELPIEMRGSDGKCKVSRLLPDPTPGNEILRMEIPTHGRLRGVPHAPGTREYLYCERGALDLHIGGEHFSLSAGDLCVFRGDQPHSYVNRGSQKAIGLAVVSLAHVLDG